MDESTTNDCRMCADEPKVRELLVKLQKLRMRATYKAVWEHLNGGAAAFNPNPLEGHVKDPLHSWVVRQNTGEPTGYEEAEKHKSLRANRRWIDNAATLERKLSE